MSWTTKPEEKEQKEEKKTIKKHRARRKAKDKPAKGLLDALRFIKHAQKKTGTKIQTHCAIRGNWIVATDEILTMGVKIQEDLSACPQTYAFEEALKKVEDDFSITQLSSDKLAVTSGDLKAIIDCAEFSEITLSAPDEKACDLDNEILNAIEVLAPLATDGATDAVCASVFIKEGSGVATNKRSLVEYWHGLNLPPMLIPRKSADALLKVKKNISGFGFSGPSATFYFEDGSFLKTQLFQGNYVNYESFFKDPSELWEVPEEFFKAIKTIEKLSKHAIIHFKDGRISSEDVEESASTYEIPTLPEGLTFHTTYLLCVEKACKKISFDYDGNQIFIFGDKTRGVVQGIAQ